MTTATAKPEAADEAAGGQRAALLRRIGVAGALIALLIGGLALFDASRTSPDDDEAEDAPAAESAAAPAAPAMPETPAEATPASIEDSPPPLPESDAAETGPAIAPDMAATGDALAQPRPSGESATVRQAPAVPETTRRPEAPVASRPATVPADTAPPALARTPAAAPSGYVVQAGVFGNAANAEELRARLALHGIPARIESRVQVGPFRTRAEADRARARMRALGMDSGPPTPVGSGTR